MTLQVDRQRLADAHQTVRSQLLAERAPAGHWVGELSSSPLSTATAISALVLAEQSGTSGGLPTFTPGEEPSHVDEIYRNDLSELIVQSIQWLARQQNEDGGWGDTDRSRSNIATTMLVQAAFHLTGVPAKYQNLLERAETYVKKAGGLAALKQRYQGDKTFAVPILANCALADMVSWRKVSSLPFELACLPQRWYHRFEFAGGQLRDPSTGGDRTSEVSPLSTRQSDNPLDSQCGQKTEPRRASRKATRQRRLLGSDAADEFCGDELGQHRRIRTSGGSPGR